MRSQALYSQYIIDGVPQEFTPAQILDSVSETAAVPGLSGDDGDDSIIDEVLDPVILPMDFDSGKTDEYLALVLGSDRNFSTAYSGTCTRVKLLSSILDSLWFDGSFKLGDISIRAEWHWNLAPVGAASAFYESVQSAADLIDSLGIRISHYSLVEDAGTTVSFEPGLSMDTDEMEDIFVREAFRSRHPVLSAKKRACPAVLDPDPQSWLVYVPFATCDFRLGGSLLSRSLALGGDVAPQVADPDYFIDCFEVLRELVEDRIVVSGVTVAEGGLMAAVSGMTSGGCGITLDLSGLMSSYSEYNAVRLLFSEVPGVLIQIRDIDFDYLDAELLLQDVAYFPLGHPVPGGGLKVDSSGKSGIRAILESLMQNAEGED